MKLIIKTTLAWWVLLTHIGFSLLMTIMFFSSYFHDYTLTIKTNTINEYAYETVMFIVLWVATIWLLWRKKKWKPKESI